MTLKKSFRLKEPEFYLNKGYAKSSAYPKMALEIGQFRDKELLTFKLARKHGCEYKSKFNFEND